MASTDCRAKVDLIDGFLGAGKTTFIKRYTQYLKQQGISYIVLENEFGAAGVDARLLDENVRELSGGCICCGMKANFHDTLIELSRHAERIIVEPSGIFNADDFFDIMDSPRVREVAEYGMMAGIVDPYSLSSLSEADRQVLYSDLICAGIILLSRTDRADEALLADAEAILSEILGTMPETADARTAPIEKLMQYAPVRREHIRMRQDHSTLFQCTTLYPEEVYTEESLLALSEKLFSGDVGNVLRIKGIFRTENGMILLNAASDSRELTRCDGSPVLNVIGRKLHRRVIRELLREYSL